jgi:broad specificity phosphatase PhoE
LVTSASVPIKARTDDRLLENDFGEWTGRPGAQAWAFRDAELERTGADPFTWRWPGGESRADIATRIRSFLGDVRRDTVVVAHRWPIVALRGFAVGLAERNLWDFEAKNAAVIEIRDGREYQHGQ